MKRVQLFLSDNIYYRLIETKADTSESLSKITRDVFELGFPLWLQKNEIQASSDSKGLLDAERIAIMASAETLVLLRKIANTVNPEFSGEAKKEVARFMKDKWEASKK